MDPQQVKSIAWWLSLGAGGLALLASVLSVLGKRDRAHGWARPAAFAIGGALLLAMGTMAVLGTRPEGSGLRGVGAAAAMGLLIIPLASLLAAFRAARPEDDDAPPVPVLLPGVFAIGACTLAMGLIAQRYGIRANLHWEALVLGLSLGLLWTVCCARALSAWSTAEALSSSLTAAALAAIALPWTTILATHHFPWPSTAPWFVLYCAGAIVAGWTLAVVVVSAMSQGAGNATASVLTALIMSLALGGAAQTAQSFLVGEPHLMPTIAAGLLGALLTLSVTFSPGATHDAGRTVRPDTLAAVSCILVLCGVSWIAFKLWLGLGVAVAAMAYLAAFPAAAALGVGSPSIFGLRIPERATALGGGFLLLLAGMKIYQQQGNMMLTGIDLADGNVTAALVGGMVVPVVLEALIGRRPVDALPPPAAAFMSAVGRFLACVLAGAATVVGGALYFGVEGLAAFLVGLAVWSLLAAASSAASRDEAGLLTFRSLPLAPSIVALAVILLPHRDALALVTRAQKMQILSGVALVAAVALLLIGIVTRRSAPPEPTPES